MAQRELEAGCSVRSSKSRLAEREQHIRKEEAKRMEMPPKAEKDRITAETHVAGSRLYIDGFVFSPFRVTSEICELSEREVQHSRESTREELVASCVARCSPKHGHFAPIR